MPGALDMIRAALAERRAAQAAGRAVPKPLPVKKDDLYAAWGFQQPLEDMLLQLAAQPQSFPAASDSFAAGVGASPLGQFAQQYGLALRGETHQQPWQTARHYDANDTRQVVDALAERAALFRDANARLKKVPLPRRFLGADLQEVPSWRDWTSDDYAETGHWGVAPEDVWSQGPSIEQPTLYVNRYENTRGRSPAWRNNRTLADEASADGLQRLLEAPGLRQHYNLSLAVPDDDDMYRKPLFIAKARGGAV